LNEGGEELWVNRETGKFEISPLLGQLTTGKALLPGNREIEKMRGYEPQLWCLGCRLESTRLSHSTLSALKATR
jgi:hypothetical protein